MAAELLVHEKPACTTCKPFRTREPVYKELGLAGKEASDEAAISLMASHPSLMHRPVVRGDRAVLARPPERVLELLD